MDKAIIGHDGPTDTPCFADYKFSAMDIAGKFANNLNLAVTDDIARDLHAGAKDGWCTG
jgi:hypothetical protein